MKLEECPNVATYEVFYKALRYIQTHHNIFVALSGGADSDIMLDIIYRVCKDSGTPLNKFTFVFFDTGIEYQATKEHLDYLEQKYNIKIERHKAITPVPLGCKRYGVPFLSKYVSEMIDRLQKHNFKFEDEPFDVLYAKYPRCKTALNWWCNRNPNESKTGRISSFNIAHNKYLKEFMIQNPPTFKISQKCCKGAKKDNAHKLLKDLGSDLNCVGIRKAEGGARSTAYKNCFSDNRSYDSTTRKDYNEYRPIFWFTDQDKVEYEEWFGVKHSECYCKYCLKRTGCVGCPFGRNFEEELAVAEKYEPKLYKAVTNIFKDSYEYTRAYREFKSKKGVEECQ